MTFKIGSLSLCGEEMKRIRYALVFLVIAALLIVCLKVIASITFQDRIKTKGTINSVNIKVFRDLNCTEPLTTIEWGAIDPNKTVSQDIYIKNFGNVGSAIGLEVDNWNPANASQFFNVSSNFPVGQVVYPNQVYRIALSLAVDSNISSSIQSFSFDIIVTNGLHANVSLNESSSESGS